MMKSDAKQTMVLIGVALLAIAGVILYVTLRQPGVYEAPAGSEKTVVSAAADTDASPESKPTAQERVSISYPLNINTATVDELAQINGIGEARASAIVEYREYLGGYSSVEQIKEIKGIGDAVYAEIAGYLTV